MQHCWKIPHLVVVVSIFAIGNVVANGMRINETELRNSLYRYEKSNRQWNSSYAVELLVSSIRRFESLSLPCTAAVANWTRALTAGELWALKMIDANGKYPPNGLLAGNLFSLGSFVECASTFHNEISTANALNGQYCTVSVSISNQTVQMKWGVCIPQACNSTDLMQMAQYLPHGTELGQFVAASADCQLNELSVSSLGISGFCVLAIFASLVLVTSTYETLFAYSKGQIVELVRGFFYQFADNPFRKHEHDRALLISAEADLEDSIDRSGSESVALGAVSNDDANASGKWAAVFSAFSLRRNVSALFSTQRPNTQVDCLDGLRVLSMVWIITGHTYFLASQSGFVSDLLLVSQHYAESYSFQLMWNATFSVDTFFVMSGLLTTLVTLRRIQRCGGPRRFGWHLFYIHRYLRLTPLYAVVLYLFVSIYPYLTAGPLWRQQSNQECSTYWWTNLLYINNFYNLSAPCFFHGWYLANDMQFYMISPLVIVPLIVAPISGVFVILALVVVSAVSTAVISTMYGISANPADMWQQKNVDSFGTVNNAYAIYIKPYCRVGSYAIGMFAGYLLFRTKCRIRLHPWFVLIGWFLSATLACTVIWCLYDVIRGATTLTDEQSAAYLSLSRIAWSISVAWLIVACTTGYAGWLNRFLSWKLFLPCARLTYCAYLVHPPLIAILYGYLQSPVDIRELSAYYYSAGNIIMAYGMAIFLTLTFEMPILNLEKLMFGRVN